ncbi:hypothetical protein DER44DRAFT_857588 [Fusarium oxysporum]|nr:hypothetical protein DER44DRAFT_857588 [Fusarium oxysporum]
MIMRPLHPFCNPIPRTPYSIPPDLVQAKVNDVQLIGETPLVAYRPLLQPLSLEAASSFLVQRTYHKSISVLLHKKTTSIHFCIADHSQALPSYIFIMASTAPKSATEKVDAQHNDFVETPLKQQEIIEDAVARGQITSGYETLG